MILVLWIIAGLLAVDFLFACANTRFVPAQELARPRPETGQ